MNMTVEKQRCLFIWSGLEYVQLKRPKQNVSVCESGLLHIVGTECPRKDNKT